MKFMVAPHEQQQRARVETRGWPAHKASTHTYTPSVQEHDSDKGDKVQTFCTSVGGIQGDGPCRGTQTRPSRRSSHTLVSRKDATAAHRKEKMATSAGRKRISTQVERTADSGVHTTASPNCCALTLDVLPDVTTHAAAHFHRVSAISQQHVHSKGARTRGEHAQAVTAGS